MNTSDLKKTGPYLPPTIEEITTCKNTTDLYFANIVTDKGTIVCELYPNETPNTVASFVKLAQSGFYSNLSFHRVVPGFVIQGGDPKGNGTGGPGYNVPGEHNSRKHLKGALAMARSQHRDSAGSQFYITLDVVPYLDGQYTVFGQTVKGIEVVDKIAQNDKILSIKIEIKPAH